MRALGCWWLAGALLAGCAVAEERYCKLGGSQVVARTESKLIDGVALAALEQRGQGAVLVWSDSAGAHGVALDARGTPRSAPVRLGERCDGGLALASGRALALGCLRRAVPGDVTAAGSAEVFDLHDEAGRLRATPRARHTPAGSLSEGIAIAWAEPPGEPAAPAALALAWHDGSPDAHRIWLVADAGSRAPQLVSSAGSVAQAPMLVSRGGDVALAFGERTVRGDALESATMLWTGRARVDAARGKLAPIAARREREDKAPHPLPQLVFVGDQLVVGYRAAGRGGQKPGLHLARVEGSRGPNGAIAEPRAAGDTRIGRADGAGRPSLAACMGGIVTATPRSYSGDYFIGLNWVSRAFVRPRREQQFYEDARAFTETAAACLGDHALIALAELPQLDRDGSDLHVATYACE